MLTTVAGPYQFGLAISESGLNAISAGLRTSKPELFQKTDKVPVKLADPGNPADHDHLLISNAMIREAIAFNLHPFAAQDPGAPSSFLAKAHIRLVLTDSFLGNITRLGVVAQAGASFISDPGTDDISIRLLRHADGTEWFDILELTGEHNGVTLSKGQLDASAAVSAIYAGQGGDDQALGRSFRAIVNYLILLFLKDPLRRQVTEFPVPKASRLVSFGKLDDLKVQQIAVNNDLLHTRLGDREAPGDYFAGGPSPGHLNIGITSGGLERMLRAMGDIPIEHPPAADGHLTLYLENFKIRNIRPTLHPSLDRLSCWLNFGGNVYIKIRFRAINRDFEFDVPIPIDSTLSTAWGILRPYMAIDRNANGSLNEAGNISIGLNPDFIIPIIVTDYRSVISNAIRNWIRNIGEEVIPTGFCHIPFLGWLVCATVKLIELLGAITGWIMGAALDVAASTLLSTLGYIIINVAITVFKIKHLLDPNKPEISLGEIQIKQADLKKQCGLIARGGQVGIGPNRDGEVVASLMFDDSGVPVAPPPSPEPYSLPVLSPLPDIAATPMNPPQYSDSDFEPSFWGRRPQWTDGYAKNYRMVLSAGGKADGEFTGVFATVKRDGQWAVSYQAKRGGTDMTYSVEGIYGSDGLLQEGKVLTATTEAGIFRHSFSRRPQNRAVVEFQAGQSPLDTVEVSLRRATPLELETIWLLNMGLHDLEEMGEKTISRFSLLPPKLVTAWARQVPIKLSIREEIRDLSRHGIRSKDIWVISGKDEETNYEIVVSKASRGVVVGRVSHHAASLTFSAAP